VVRFTLRPLYPQGKNTLYELDRRLGGPQSRSGHGINSYEYEGMPCIWETDEGVGDSERVLGLVLVVGGGDDDDDDDDNDEKSAERRG
jgi:hypothetical protein